MPPEPVCQKNTFIHESIFIIDDSKRKKKYPYQTFPISRAKSKDCTKKHAGTRAFCICFVSYRFLYSTNSGFTPSFSYVHTSRKSMPAIMPKLLHISGTSSRKTICTSFSLILCRFKAHVEQHFYGIIRYTAIQRDGNPMLFTHVIRRKNPISLPQRRN